MLLMTGHDFTLKLRANSVASESDASITNDDITVQFFVPADTGECRFDYEQGATIASAHNMWVYWQVETEPAGTPEWELYRKNVLVRKYPAKITWDCRRDYPHGESRRGTMVVRRLTYGEERDPHT
jgi:hypothetical protein